MVFFAGIAGVVALFVIAYWAPSIVDNMEVFHKRSYVGLRYTAMTLIMMAGVLFAIGFVLQVWPTQQSTIEKLVSVATAVPMAQVTQVPVPTMLPAPKLTTNQEAFHALVHVMTGKCEECDSRALEVYTPMTDGFGLIFDDQLCPFSLFVPARVRYQTMVLAEKQYSASGEYVVNYYLGGDTGRGEVKLEKPCRVNFWFEDALPNLARAGFPASPAEFSFIFGGAEKSWTSQGRYAGEYAMITAPRFGSWCLDYDVSRAQEYTPSQKAFVDSAQVKICPGPR